jgi:RNA polymerase sigma factor (sigma-70 family)
MVWGVCRRVLGDHHAAEDAFQATFLVFVRKASRIASGAVVASWLHAVARRTALKARALSARRKIRERQVDPMPEPVRAEQEPGHEWHDVLDDELNRLPAKYRAVVVLCDLEGATRGEAARQLGCPEGTVAGRLARARQLLAGRLARRGVVVSSGALAAVTAPRPASALVPLLDSTITAAGLMAAGRIPEVSATVALITERVERAMLMTKIKGAVAVLALVLVVTVGLALRPTPAAGQPGASPDALPGALPGPQPGPQPAPKATEVGRYQISAYGYGFGVGAGSHTARGAYIIDTATGEVFHVTGENKPVPIGSVKDKK